MHRIAVIPGDGIGPEVIEQALIVLDKVSSKFSMKFEYIFIDAGGCAIDKYGVPIREEDLELVKNVRQHYWVLLVDQNGMDFPEI